MQFRKWKKCLRICCYLMRNFILIYASHMGNTAFLLVVCFFGLCNFCNVVVSRNFCRRLQDKSRSIVYDQPCDRESSWWSHTYSFGFIVLRRRQRPFPWYNMHIRYNLTHKTTFKLHLVEADISHYYCTALDNENASPQESIMFSFVHQTDTVNN